MIFAIVYFFEYKYFRSIKKAPSQYENISLGRTICPWYHLTSVKPLSRIQETSDMPAL